MIKDPTLGGTTSTKGTKTEVVRRVFSMREFIMAVYKLDAAVVYPPALEEVKVCSKCAGPEEDSDNQLIQCVAMCDKSLFHMKCAEVDHIPGEWLCAPCIKDGVYVIKFVLDKRIQNGTTWYKVVWLGHEQGQPEWQKVKDVPPGSRYLINDFNAERRRIASEGGGDGFGGDDEGSGSHHLLNSKVAKNFGDGAIFYDHACDLRGTTLCRGGSISSTKTATRRTLS